MKKIFLILIANVYLVSAQSISTFSPKINNIPSSPEAALFQRFGDIPVGYYNGTAKVSVPIYTIEEAGVQIPIELRYQSSGIKVDDEATWVGLGWDLFPGGAIIQEVKGIRDEYDAFYNPNPLEGYTTFKNRLNNAGPVGGYKNLRQSGHYNYNSTGCYTICENGQCVEPQVWVMDPSDADSGDIVSKLLLGHGQPDIYHYNFAGYSGKFYINWETHNVVLIDRKEDIHFVINNGNSIVATTLDGTVFNFNIIETSYYLGFYQNSEKSGKTFKLGNIQFNNGTVIDFTYTDAHTSRLAYKQNALLNTCDMTSAPNTPTPTLDIASQSDIKILTKITAPDLIIDFNLEDREDINLYNTDNQKRLKSIDIKCASTLKKVKTFKFNYSYFPYNLIGNPGVSGSPILSPHLDVLGKRLKLDSVKEIGYNDNETEDNSKPPFRFDYNVNHIMPLKISFAKDFYGYYNGENNSGLMPDLDYFDYPYMDAFLTHTNFSPFTYNGYYKSRRFTNNQFMGTYMLNKITYPTGGYTKFEFEPNTFNNQFIPNSSQIDIANKHTILQNNGQGNPDVNYRKNFVLSKATTITFNNSIHDGSTGQYNLAPVYTHNDFSGSKIVLKKTKLLSNGQSSVTILKQWESDLVLNVDFENNHGKVWYDEIRIAYDSDPSVYYTVETINTLNYSPSDTYHIAGLKSDFHFYDDTGVDTSQSYGCGMRIKAIKSYTELGVLAKNKTLKYYNGKLLNHFDPLRRLQTWCFFCTPPGLPGSCHCSALIEGIPTTEISISSDFMNQRGIVGYDKVEEIEVGDNSQTLGKIAFTFLNLENLSSNGFDDVEDLRRGLPLEEFIYEKSGNLLLKTTYAYTNLNNAINCFYSLRIETHFKGNINPKENASISRWKHSYYASPILSEWNMLTGKTTTEYFNSGQLVNSESYTYNSQGKIKTITKVNSNNESLITKYYYPIDQLINSNIDNLMINLHYTGTPVITENYNGVQLLSTQKTIFESTPGGIQPKYIYSSKGNNGLERKVTFDQYDDRGNLLQYTVENGAPTAFKWDSTKTRIIHIAENATYQQLSSGPISNLTNSFVTTYTHKPLIGVSSVTDSKGDTKFYDYDSFGRLISVRDRNGSLLMENEYNFTPQN